MTRKGPRVSHEERFWEKVEKTDGCWNWMRSTDEFGYGNFSVGTKGIRAHCFSWSLIHGPIPSGMQVCHHCDNPKCVNPDHLFLGTQKQNIDDMMAKGRGGGQLESAENNRNHKLTWEQVREIRRLYVPGEYGYGRLAKQFNCTLQNVAAIVRGETWIEMSAERLAECRRSRDLVIAAGLILVADYHAEQARLAAETHEAA